MEEVYLSTGHLQYACQLQSSAVQAWNMGREQVERSSSVSVINTDCFIDFTSKDAEETPCYSCWRERSFFCSINSIRRQASTFLKCPPTQRKEALKDCRILNLLSKFQMRKNIKYFMSPIYVWFKNRWWWYLFIHIFIEHLLCANSHSKCLIFISEVKWQRELPSWNLHSSREDREQQIYF